MIVLEKYYRLASWFALVGIVVLQGSGIRGQGSGLPVSTSPIPLLSHSIRSTRSLPLAVLSSVSESQERVRQAQLGESYGKLPLSFEQNRGQVDGKVNFLSRGNGYTLFLTPTEAVLSLSTRSSNMKKHGRLAHDKAGTAMPPIHSRSSVLRMKLVGANPSPQVDGLEELPGKSNYFIGSDPAKWRTNVATYARVRYRDVYPGIDLVYYGNRRQLEYDWIVSPGAEPGAIKFAVPGAKRIKVDSKGDLVLEIGAEDVRLHKPVIYQETDGVRHEIAGAYVLRDNRQLGFRLADYDPTRDLVIDPVLSYSTYLGGSGRDQTTGIAVDSSGNAYVTGFTNSTNFPTATPLQPANAGGAFDAFVVKLNAAGSALVYSTYLGGSGDDVCADIAVDGSGNAYVSGFTSSTNFPTANPLQPAHGGGAIDSFVVKLNPSGSALVYSTYLGGSGDERFEDAPTSLIAVDGFGNAYITGFTASANFPTANALQPAPAGGGDAFVTKLNAAGSALVYSTYLGGSGFDASFDIAVDGSGSAYVTGVTGSTDFPTVNPLQAAHGGGGVFNADAFVAKLSAAGPLLVYSTYLGGSGDEYALGIAVDGSGNAYVTGNTDSTNFPTANPFQALKGASEDAFVTKLNAAGAAFVYSTYLGGNDNDLGHSIAVDGSGNAYVGGEASSTDFPTVNPLQAVKNGGGDVFVTKFNAAGTAPLVYSTYLGGSNDDWDAQIALDGSGNVYLTGSTMSTNFPTAASFQGANAGMHDAFVAKIGEGTSPTVLTVSPTTVNAGGSVTATWANITSPTANDWLGLYNSPAAADNAYLKYQYTDGQASGNLPFTIPSGAAAGTTYELRLFTNGSYTRLATSNSFTDLVATLSVSPTTVNSGQLVRGPWTNIANPTSGDWIALYASSGTANTSYLTYRYTNGQANGDLGFLGLRIPAGTAAGTTYELRLFSNGSYTRLATSNSFTVLLATLSVSPTTVNPGGSVTATWTNIANPTSTDWIGLYSSSAALNTSYLSYRYTNGQGSSNVPFTIPTATTAGTTYELRLFRAGTYTQKMATSNSFTVQVTTLSVSPTTVNAGTPVTATWANIASPTANDWIALYSSSGAANTSYLSYRYTNGQASSNLPLTIPAGTAAGSTYELRLFTNGSYTRLATSNSFTVQVTTLSVSPASVNPGLTVTATWTNIASPTTNDWIGLFASSGAANTAYLSYRYTNGQATSGLPFTIPAGATPGSSYELRLFSNGSYTRLATSNTFSIQVATLSVSPTSVSPGGSVTATWTNIANPTGSDWIGLFASSGASNFSFISYRYTDGQANGSLPFTIPGGAAPGTTYELRLFSNNTFTRLAASNTFTIEGPLTARLR